MSPRRDAAFTWVEAMVAIAVIGVLLLLVLPSPFFSRGRLVSGQKTQTLSNMKQLHLATQSMALDGVSERNTNLAWPGDTGGTFTDWMRQLVPTYLGTNDFCKLLSAPGVVYGTHCRTMNEGALCIYAVRDESSDSTVFLTTANFTNTPLGGAPLLKSAKPYGDTGFVVFRKGGDGAILLKDRVGKTNIIGTWVPLLK
jgi:type II secretory pathway pseudopilin PulG